MFETVWCRYGEWCLTVSHFCQKESQLQEIYDVCFQTKTLKPVICMFVQKKTDINKSEKFLSFQEWTQKNHNCDWQSADVCNSGSCLFLFLTWKVQHYTHCGLWLLMLNSERVSRCGVFSWHPHDIAYHHICFQHAEKTQEFLVNAVCMPNKEQFPL